MDNAFEENRCINILAALENLIVQLGRPDQMPLYDRIILADAQKAREFYLSKRLWHELVMKRMIVQNAEQIVEKCFRR